MKAISRALREQWKAVIAATLLLPGSTSLRSQTAGPEYLIRNEVLTGSAFEVVAVSDGASGYVAWVDTRSDVAWGDDVYVQKVNPDGSPAWTTDGYPACDLDWQQYEPTLAPDGAGGVLVAWRDQRISGGTAIFAQLVDPAGQPRWSPGGVQIGDEVYKIQYAPTVHRAPDGTFLLTHGEERDPPGSPREYWHVVQKIDENGQRLWGPTGVAALEGIRIMHSVPDGSGGVVVFGRIREGTDGWRFQRVDASQTIRWTSPPEVAAELPFTPRFGFAEDGQGGAVIAYIEDGAAKAARLDGNGAKPWGAEPVVLSDGAYFQESPVVLPDGQGGAYIGWVESSPRDLRIQHVRANGVFAWGPDGAEVPDGVSQRTFDLMPDGDGGLFVIYETSSSVRVNRLNAAGINQWVIDGSNALGLGSGSDPFILAGSNGPLAVFDTFDGLASRLIQVPAPFRLAITDVTQTATIDLTLAIDGGDPGATYELFRTEDPGDPNWQSVGSLEAGDSLVDSIPAAPAFYQAHGE